MHKNKCVDKPKEKTMVDGRISVHNKNVHSGAPKVVLFFGASIWWVIGQRYFIDAGVWILWWQGMWMWDLHGRVLMKAL